MGDLSLLVFFTQLGLTVALPLAGFILLAVWLQNTFALGSWVIWVGIILGLWTAFSGLRSTLKTMSRLAKGKKEAQDPGVSFNDHD